MNLLTCLFWIQACGDGVSLGHPVAWTVRRFIAVSQISGDAAVMLPRFRWTELAAHPPPAGAKLRLTVKFGLAVGGTDSYCSYSVSQ